MKNIYQRIGLSKTTTGFWLIGLLLGLLGGAGPARAQAPAWQLALSGNANQPTKGTSDARASALDASGNVFVTGSFTGQVTFGNTMLNSGGDTDVFLAKWNAQANTWAWAVRGGGNGRDAGTSVAVSGSSVYVTGSFAPSIYSTGNVVIAGTALASAGEADIFLAKFTDNGTSASDGWAVRAGTAASDGSNAVAASGTSVYIAGFYAIASGGGTTLAIAGNTLTSVGFNDGFLAKYVDNGTSAGNGWAVNIGGTESESVTALVASGNRVYLTGHFFSPTLTVAGTTLTNSPLSGNYQLGDIFVAKYLDNGTSAGNGWAVSGGGTGYDYSYGLAVSGSSVYVAGALGSGQAAIAGTTFTTLAGYGNAFVAKYEDSGAAAIGGWATAVATPAATTTGTGYSTAYGVAANGGAVYLTGYFIGTQTLAGTRLVGLDGTTDTFVAKYLDNGTSASSVWANSGGGGEITTVSGTDYSIDGGYSVQVSGNRVYVLTGAGVAPNQFGTAPLLTAPAKSGALAQLDASGGTWQRVDAPLQGGTSQTLATATDASGNVFVTGTFTGNLAFGTTQLASLGTTDYFLAKWSPATSTWAWAVSGGGPGDDQALGLAVSAGGIYLTGSFTGSAILANTTLTAAGNTDLFVAKYTDNGTTAAGSWAVRGGGTDAEVASSIAVSGTGVFVTGYFTSSTASIAGANLATAGYRDIFVAKFIDNGTSAGNGWAIGSGGTLFDQGQGIAVSGSNVYVTGYLGSAGVNIAGTTLNSSGNADLFVAKYVDNGTTAGNGWAVQGTGDFGEYGQAVAVSGSSVYVAGYFGSTTSTIAGTTFTNAGSFDLFVAKYLDNGTSASDGWAVQGGGASTEYANGIALKGGVIYVTGSFGGSASIAGSSLYSAGGSDVFLARYVDNGSSGRGGGAVGGGGSGNDVGYGVATSGSNVYVGGTIIPKATIGSSVFNNPVASNLQFLGRITEPAPTLSSFSPTSGYEGVSLSLYGTNLSSTSLITFSGISNNTVSGDFTASTSGSSLTGVIVPAGAITGPISVTTAGGTATSAGVFTVTAAVPNPVPTITSLSPATVPAGSGAFVLSVSGTGFVARCVVRLNGVALPTTLYSATQVVATVPASAVATAGSYPVTITNPTPAGGASAPATFTVAVPQGPVISGFAPGSGPVGTTITLSGTDLARTSVIRFAGVGANTVSTGFTINSTGTQITGVVVPAGAQTGPVQATTPLGTGSSAASFTVTNAGAPTISAFTPVSAPAGASVIVTGTNLSSLTALVVNGVAVPPGSLRASTNTSFTFVVPAGAPATGTSSATTTSGTAISATFRVVLRAISSAPAFNSNQGPLASSMVAVTFSEPVSGAGLVVYSAQAGGRKQGTVAASGSTVSFVAAPGTPATSFKPGETVQVTVPGTARTAAGILSAKRVFQFNTAASGTGRGTFQPGSTPAVAAASWAITSGDVDGDGDLDLLTGNVLGTTVSLLRNDGTGAYGPATSIAVGTGPTDLALADVDGDGDLDLLASNYTSNTVSVRLNSGNGTFSGTQDVAMPPNTAPDQLALGDVDGDGDLDLLVGSSTNLTSAVTLRLNGGDATGSNTGVFSGGQSIAVGSESRGVALADIDGDGDLDVLAASLTNGFVQVRLNGGDATGSNTGVFSGSGFVGVGDTPASIAMGDIDGDGDLDLLTANYGSNNVSVRFNDGTGNFINYTTNVNVAVGSGPFNIALADVDADGDLDLLTANAGYGADGNSVSVRLNGGNATGSNTGVFSGGSTVAVGNYPRSLTVGDFDADGDLDLATPNGSSGLVSVRLNGGTVLATTRAADRLAFSLYPNPASRAALVAGLPAGQPITLLDAVGRTIATAQADSMGKAVVTWPASTARGIYILRAGSQAQRLTIE